MNSFASLLSNKKKALILFAVSLLSLATVITRTIDNEKNMQWFDDSGRDTIVAKLIVENGKYTDIRPGAGLLPALKNSTLYYNYLAGLYRLSGKNAAVFFDLYATISGIITVISTFFIGYILMGLRLALPAALTVLLHPLIIFINVSIYQRHLLASLTPLFVLFALLAYRKKTLLYLWLATIGYLLLLCANYAAITLLPILLWIHYDFFANTTKKKKILLHIGFLLISIGAFWSTIGFDWHEIQIKDAAASSNSSLFYPLYQIFYFFQALFNWKLKYITVFLVVIVLLLLLKRKKTGLEKLFYWILATYFIFQLGLGYGMSTIHMSSLNLESDYFYHYLALFLVVPYLSVLDPVTNRGLKKVFVALFILVVIAFPAFLATQRQAQPRIEYKKNYFRTKAVADSILAHQQHMHVLNGRQPVIIDNTIWEPPPGWFAPSLVFHAIRNTGEYYALRTIGNNLKYRRKEFDSFYLVCRHWAAPGENTPYSNNPDIITKSCVNDLFTNYINGTTPDDYAIETVYRETAYGNDNFVVLFIDMKGRTLSSEFLLNPWPDPPQENLSRATM